MAIAMQFETINPEICQAFTYKGKPCTITKIGKVEDRIRAVYVQLRDGTPEFVHIGLEKDTFQNIENAKVA